MAREKREVIVRGMTATWFADHFQDMKVYFSGLRAVPQYDSDFIGFYLEAPTSAITHIGVVDSIDRQPTETTFHLRAVIKLERPVPVDHGIRKQEYWTFKDLGIEKVVLLINDFSRVGSTSELVPREPLLNTTPGITPEELIQHVSTLEGLHLTTAGGRASFTARALPHGIEVTPESSGTARFVSLETIQLVIGQYEQSRNLQPAQYQSITFDASYLLGIIAHYLQERLGG